MAVNLNNFRQQYNRTEIKNQFHDAFSSGQIDFHSAVMEAHKMTIIESLNKKASYIAKNWMAETMYGNIIGILTDRHPELMDKDSTGRIYLQLTPNIRIYIKKLDNSYRPANAETDKVKELWANNIFEDNKRIHVGYVGYILNNEEWADIQGVYSSYTHIYFKGQVEWVLDMQDYTKAVVKMSQKNQTEDIFVTPKKLQKTKED